MVHLKFVAICNMFLMPEAYHLHIPSSQEVIGGPECLPSSKEMRLAEIV